jgi:small-conductance mechanosensitive channel
LRADIDEAREVQANITDSAAEKAEKAESKDGAPALQEHDVKSTGTKLLSAIFPSAFPKAPKANGKDGKAVTDPKAAYDELHAAYSLWLVEFKNSLRNQRAAFKGDRKALAQLEKQAVKVLEDAEKNFVKASEEAAAAAAVDMRKEAFKELTDKAKAKTFKELTDKVKAKADPKPAQVGVVKVMVAKEKSAAAADNALEGVAAAGKAPIHLENAGTGIIPPA